MSEATQLATVFEDTQCYDTEVHDLTPNEAFFGHASWIPASSSLWAEELKSRLNELTSLPRGWDGYAGKPVTPQCAYFAMNMLERLCRDKVPPPSLVPGGDGSLQVEWHRNGYDVELDVLGVNNVVATLLCCENEEKDQELEIKSDFSPIAEWIDLIADDNDEATTKDV